MVTKTSIKPQKILTQPKGHLQNLLLWSTRFLVSTVWISALLFGAYIFIFYFIGALKGNIVNWNKVLPNLYHPDSEIASISIGAHFAAGGLILMLGCIQLIERIRVRYPFIHRWLGRLYVLLSMVTAIGGLLFIILTGTVGGISMDIGFTGYGVLTFISAVATIYYARTKKFDLHKAWSIRLFALAIGSWLYRMYYGFWFLIADGIGHYDTFDGPFDQFMNFFFYVPNLIIAEICIGKIAITKTILAQTLATIVTTVASVFLILATYYFTIKLWWPAIVEVIRAT